MGQRAAIFLHYRKPGGLGWFLLVAVLSLALIWVGCLVWIDNSLAIIPDNDPRTSFLLEGGSAARAKPAQLHQAGPVSDSGGGALVVRGNGDRDDNREEAFYFQAAAGLRVPAEYRSAVSGFKQLRTAVAYKDFGHLKIMVAEGGHFDIFTSVFIHKEGCSCIMGGLYYC